MNFLGKYFCWLAVFLPSLWHESSSTDVIYSTLYDNLFRKYKPQLLPICSTGPRFVNVSLDIALRQIIRLNEKDQVLTTNVWVRMGWTDCRLKWNSSQYGGINDLRVPYSDVWTPDLALYDSCAEEIMLPGLTENRARISDRGWVQYNFPTVLSSVCRVKATYFPFDTQSCGLRFSSWSHSQSDIDFYPVNLSGDLKVFIINNEWIVRDLVAKRIVANYTKIFVDIEFTVIITRRSDFYVMTMLFPCVLVSAIAALGFLLPSESGEKVSLEVTVLLSQAVFLLVVSDFLPPSAENFPILGIYFAVSMSLVGMSLVMSVLVLNVHHRGDVKGKPVPNWTRKYLLRNHNTCCTNKEYDLDSPESTGSRSINQFRNMKETAIDTSNRENVKRPSNKYTKDRHDISRINGSIPPTDTDRDCFKTKLPGLLLEEHNRTLVNIEKHFTDADDSEDERESWRALARVIDRMCLLLYVICFAIVTTVFVSKLMSPDDFSGNRDSADS